jgi:beta-lactamase class A
MKKTTAPTMICLLALGAALGAQTTPGSRLATAAVRTPGLDAVRWASLKKNVTRVLGEFTGVVGLVVKDLTTGREIRLNENRRFPSASMVKVPIMAACFKAIEDGRLALEDTLTLKAADKVRGSGHLRAERSGTSVSIQELLEIMVTESDNTAANMLIDRLGADGLNAAFADMGLVHTRLARKMMDFRSRRNGVENYTTPGEMAGLFERIYRGACFGPEVSAACLTLLKAQKVNNRISRYLPRTVEFAHKTGLELTVCHDAGILYTRRGNVLVCVLTEGDTGAIIAGRWIGRLGKVIYGAYK